MNTLTPEQQKEVDTLNDKLAKNYLKYAELQASAQAVWICIRALTKKRCEITGE